MQMHECLDRMHEFGIGFHVSRRPSGQGQSYVDGKGLFATASEDAVRNGHGYEFSLPSSGCIWSSSPATEPTRRRLEITHGSFHEIRQATRSPHLPSLPCPNTQHAAMRISDSGALAGHAKHAAEVDERKRVWVVVLGDFGRSPRMQYHTLSLAEQVWRQQSWHKLLIPCIRFSRDQPRLRHAHIAVLRLRQERRHLPHIIAEAA